MLDIDYINEAKDVLKKTCNTKLIEIPQYAYPITVDDIVCYLNYTLDYDKSKWYVKLAMPKITPDSYLITNNGVTYPDLYSITIIKNGYLMHLKS